MRLVARLALADTLHDRRLFICCALTIAAVLGPLLLLLGLKTAVIDHLLAQLRADPMNREIVHIGNRRFDEQWFAAMQARPDVAFVVPRTREISTQIDVGHFDAAHPDDPIRGFDAELVVSAAGDPQLGADAASISPTQTVISQRLARQAHFAVGDKLEVWATRRGGDGPHRGNIVLTVTAIAPERAYQRAALFVPLPVARDLEDFSDGRAVAARGWAGDPPPQPRTYASFRLYARDIGDVAGLEQTLLQQDLNVTSNAGAIAWTMTLDRQLTNLFAIIAVCAGTGVAAALFAILWANVTRKRRELSLLRMMGVSQRLMPTFPLMQGALTALVGAAVAGAVAEAVAAALNAVYAGLYLQDSPICHVAPVQVLAATGGAVAVAVLAGLAAALPILRIAPAEGIRGG